MRTISLSYAFVFSILARGRRPVATNFLLACSRLSGNALGSFTHGYGISNCPSNLLQESSITFASFLSMGLNFMGLQEHGFMDTRIDSVLLDVQSVCIIFYKHIFPFVVPDNGTSNITTISDITLTEEEVCAVLKALDEDKATGPDKIPALLLKKCAVNISSSLCRLFNKSLSCGILPSEWKLANISSIPKRSPNNDVSNYRPLSLLSLISKAIERCIYNRLIEHVHGQIYELQYGFLRGKSTTSQLLHVLQQFLNVLEQKNQVDIVYLDFAKAFDKVSHNLLLVKLHNFGIRGNLLQWFRDFLSGRFQRVTALGVSSEPLPVLSGVPQGPLLFIIYVNDLPKSVSQDTTMAIFADDTKCYRPTKNSEDNKTLQSNLDNITIWCHEWKMDLNQTKCGVLHLTRSREPAITQYTVLDSPVNRSNSQRDLGMSITSDLKWNKQVQDISLKANKMLGFVKRTTHVICNQSVRKALYLTMVRSQLAYGSQVWAPQTVGNIQTIERVQRRATKFILSLPYRTDISYKDRLEILNIIPLCYWQEYLDMVYVFKSLKNDSDSNILVKVSTRETRSASNGILLNVGKCRTVNYQNSYYRVSQKKRSATSNFDYSKMT